MTSITRLSRFDLGDMAFEFWIDPATQQVSWRCFPAVLADRVLEHRAQLPGRHNGSAWRLEPLVQAKLLGDSTQGYSQGSTMRNSATVSSLRLVEQRAMREADRTTIITRQSQPLAERSTRVPCGGAGRRRVAPGERSVFQLSHHARLPARR